MSQYQDPCVLNLRKSFIGGLSANTTTESLRQYFERFGPLVDCLIMVDRDHKPRGFAFVTYKDAESLLKMLASGPHYVDDKLVDCKMAVPKENPSKTDLKARKREAKRAAASMEKNSSKVNPTQNDLSKGKSRLNTWIEQIKLPSQENISMSQVEENKKEPLEQKGGEAIDRELFDQQAQKYVEEIAKTCKLPSREEKTSEQKKSEAEEMDTLKKIGEEYQTNGDKAILAQLRKVFVGGLPHNLELQEFKDYFKNFGSIEDAVILQDKRTHKPRGFGFITYHDIRSVNLVLKLREKHTIQRKWVDVKSAVPVAQMKEVMIAQQQKQQKNKMIAPMTFTHAQQIAPHQSDVPLQDNGSINFSKVFRAGLNQQHVFPDEKSNSSQNYNYGTVGYSQMGPKQNLDSPQNVQFKMPPANFLQATNGGQQTYTSVLGQPSNIQQKSPHPMSLSSIQNTPSYFLSHKESLEKDVLPNTSKDVGLVAPDPVNIAVAQSTPLMYQGSSSIESYMKAWNQQITPIHRQGGPLQPPIPPPDHIRKVGSSATKSISSVHSASSNRKDSGEKSDCSEGAKFNKKDDSQCSKDHGPKSSKQHKEQAEEHLVKLTKDYQTSGVSHTTSYLNAKNSTVEIQQLNQAINDKLLLGNTDQPQDNFDLAGNVDWGSKPAVTGFLTENKAEIGIDNNQEKGGNVTQEAKLKQMQLEGISAAFIRSDLANTHAVIDHTVGGQRPNSFTSPSL